MTAQNETSAKNNDKDDVRSTEFRPHDPIDVTDQNTIFLVLEELGIAHMQHAWLSAHSPEHEDAEQVANQAKEFFLDSCAILGGHVGPDRVKPNDWAGAALASHLRAAVPELIEKYAEKPAAAADDEEAIASVLAAYLKSLDKLSAKQSEEAAAGREFGPKHYIDVMAAWSGLFCGLKDKLTLDDAFWP